MCIRDRTHIQGVVEKKNTLPILSNVLIQANEEGLLVTATDMDMIISEKINANVKANVGTFADVETASISAADGTASSTIANSTGVHTIASSVLTTTDINGGTIDGTIIGGSSAAAVTTSSLVATTADINAGTIDNTTIGATTPSSGVFTTIDSSQGIDITADSQSLRIGAGNDFSISHDGSNSAIANATGNLTITTAASSSVVINEGSADVDFRVESNGNTHAIFVDAGNDRVGIATS